MQIDEYAEAKALAAKIQANLPIKVFPTKQLLQSLRQQGKTMQPNQAYEVDSVFYSGDAGGIICAIKDEATDEEVYAVSITHLKVDPECPLASEIAAYQQKRTRLLAIQNGGGFAAELLAGRSANPKKQGKKKGFSR